MEFLVADDGRPNLHEGAVVGLMTLQQAAQPKQSTELEEKRINLEAALRAQFKERVEIEQSAHIQAYKAYYKRFGKSYHVLGQLESVALKGKAIPSFNPVIEAMFMAELKNQLLTAGHDLDQIQTPLKLGQACGEESYRLLGGQQQTLKKDDLFVEDQDGVISSIIYGPDQRTKISAKTQNLLFVVYGVPGISEQELRFHLQEISENIALFSPDLEYGEILLAQR